MLTKEPSSVLSITVVCLPHEEAVLLDVHLLNQFPVPSHVLSTRSSNMFPFTTTSFYRSIGSYARLQLVVPALKSHPLYK